MPMSERNGKSVTDGEKVQHIKNYLHKEIEMHTFIKTKYGQGSLEWNLQVGWIGGLNKGLDKLNGIFCERQEEPILKEKT